jgi:hypothetical protein
MPPVPVLYRACRRIGHHSELAGGGLFVRSSPLRVCNWHLANWHLADIDHDVHGVRSQA